MNKNSRPRRGLLSFRNIFILLAGVAIGMLFSPDTGRANRAKIRQRFESWEANVRKEEGRLIKKTNYEKGRMTGVVHNLGRRLHIIGERESLDDVVNQRVKTALGEDPKAPDIPRLNIDTYEGVVTLRGVVDTENQSKQITDIVEKVSGVNDVVNKIHVEEAAHAEDSS